MSQMLKTNSPLNAAAVVTNSGTMPITQPGIMRIADAMAYPAVGYGQPLLPTGQVSNSLPPQNGSVGSQVRPLDLLGSKILSSGSDSDDASTKEFQQQLLANTKEKTPMCLINELARYNKILHQYTLIDEQGPAHKKTFFVKLKLGEEEYSASGPSIKKAQHLAAAKALSTTHFQHPPPKPPKSPTMMGDMIDSNNITPTVELNALAMKRNEPAIYKAIENRQQSFYHPAGFDYRAITYNQRYQYPRMQRTFYVSLKVGSREFIGEGPTRQSARHNAAGKALRIIKSLPMPEETVQKEQPAELSNEDNDKLKSEISLVHEIALKRNLPVNFEVIRESGPPHMKTFVTKCTVGEMVTMAEGNSKKVSKKRAAELMLEELRKLQPLTPTLQRPKTKPPVNKKKNRNLIKVAWLRVEENQTALPTTLVQKADPNYGVGINPISRLIQIMQAQKKKEPVYSFVAERGLPRRREFVMQVQVEEHSCTGTGPNKKLAKRNAAEAMLQLLGFSRPSPQPAKPAIKTAQSPDGGSGDKKVTFVDNGMEAGGPGGSVTNGNKAGRQLVPGLLLLDNNASSTYVQNLSSVMSKLSLKDDPVMTLALSGQAEQRLREIAQKIKIEVLFEDFSGQNSIQTHLCQVVLKTSPHRVFHGKGSTLLEARNVAAADALQCLSELGLWQTYMADMVNAAGDCGPISILPSSSQVLKADIKAEM